MESKLTEELRDLNN